MSRYRFIHAERATYPVMILCRVLGVARSAYYAWARRGVSARTAADEALATQIAAAHARSRRTYGAPRIHAELRAQGIQCARKRVARLMRAAGLVGCHRRRRARTTVAEPTHPPAPNLVAREFRAVAPNRLWLGDITYVATREGWLYLAVLLDAYSRRVVGWAMADHLRAELARDALAMALRARRPPPGLVHHTDRGGQYTAAMYRAALADRGITVSMSRPGQCLDNAVAESFFATLKAELVDTRVWSTRAAAQLAIFEWLEVWYNRQRRHSALSYRAPVAYEDQHLLLLQDPAA
jgi:putative transposase